MTEEKPEIPRDSNLMPEVLADAAFCFEAGASGADRAEVPGRRPLLTCRVC